MLSFLWLKVSTDTDVSMKLSPPLIFNHDSHIAIHHYSIIESYQFLHLSDFKK